MLYLCGMKISAIKIKEKDTVEIQTDKAKITLKRFGKDFVCLSDIPYGFNKESELYLKIKKCLISGEDEGTSSLSQFLNCSF